MFEWVSGYVVKFNLLSSNQETTKYSQLCQKY